MPTMNDAIAKTTELPDGRKLEFYFSNANKKWQLWEIDGDKSRKVNESGSKDSVVKYANDTYSVQLKSIKTNPVEDVYAFLEDRGYTRPTLGYVKPLCYKFIQGVVNATQFNSNVARLLQKDKPDQANEDLKQVQDMLANATTKSTFFDDTIYKDGTKSVTYSRTSKMFKAMDGEECVGEYSDKEEAIKACATAKRKKSKVVHNYQFGGANVKIVMDEDDFYSVEQNGKQMANYPDEETAMKFVDQLYTDDTPYDVFSLPGGSQVKTVLAGSNTMVYKVTNGVATFLKSFSSPDKALEWVNDSYNTGN